MKKILIGKITAPAGLSGEVKILNFAESPERYRKLDRIFLGEKDDHELEIAGVRVHKGQVILKLEGCDDRNAAERLRGRELFMAEEDLEELPEGEFYIRDIIGMEVRDTDGLLVGHLTDVLTDRAQDIYVIEQPDGGKDILIPGVPEFIRNINGETGVITVRMIEGMTE